MEIVGKVAATIQNVLGPEAEELGRATGVIQRRRKFTAVSLLRMLVLTLLRKPDAKATDFQSTAAQLGLDVTSTAVENRFTPQLVGFLRAVLERTVLRVLAASPQTVDLLNKFRGASGHRRGIGPGRPGWLPTQVPHRSGFAHHAHPVPHLMNSRPARSVVGTWTWFRSRCTCQVSLQRLMRRHPLPLTGSLGLVPPLQRYYEMLRLPAAHFAALRFLRLAIPSLRPWFVPPGPGRGAVDQSGVGRRYLQPPGSMETTGSPKFPEEPL